MGAFVGFSKMKPLADVLARLDAPADRRFSPTALFAHLDAVGAAAERRKAKQAAAAPPTPK